MTKPQNFCIEEKQSCHLKDGKFFTYLCFNKVKEKKIKEKENSMSLK